MYLGRQRAHRKCALPMWSKLSRTVTAEENRKQHYKEHMEIAQAILDGKSDQAYDYMKAHMEDLERRYWS